MISSQLFSQMSINAWHNEVNAFNGLLNKLSDEQIMNETAPGRNRGIYLLGHLTAIHDMMIPLLRFGDSLYPRLKTVFVDAPDKAISNLPELSTLKTQWNIVNEKLNNYLKDLPVDEWFTRHSNISDEDFKNEPTRNRLNVLISRTNHMSYHRGQFAYLLHNDKQ